jgi:hypothetical protein
VLTLDDDIGDLEDADVHLRHGRIVAVGRMECRTARDLARWSRTSAAACCG